MTGEGRKKSGICIIFFLAASKEGRADSYKQRHSFLKIIPQMQSHIYPFRHKIILRVEFHRTDGRQQS